jgi:hypothetical protein
MLKGTDQSEDLGIDSNIILEWILGEWDGKVWTACVLDQDRDQWRALVNTVMKIRVAQKAGNFLTSLVTISFSRRTLVYEVIL